MNILTFLLSIFCRCVIFVFGWYPLDISVILKINSYKRCVLVFSHTSYVDFFVLIIYLLTYSCYLKPIRILVKPQPFDYAGKLLKALGCIPSTRIEDNNGGAIKRITSELQQLDNFAFLISPKGTIINRPWKKGYYHIAKNLDAKIIVIGFDYEQKRILMFDDYSCENYEETEIRNILQQDITKIVPLFPEDEVVEIRKHNKHLRGVINWCWLSKIVGVVYVLYLVCTY